MDKYDLHELIEEDLMEAATQDKIDVYDQCLFVVLNFPKFNTDRHKYMPNEFNMILWKDYIVTLTKYKSNHIDKIKDEYKQTLEELEKDEKYKISPYYILYRVIDEMYDKVLRGLRTFWRDLTHIEESIFENHKLDKSLLEQIMQKRRNIVMLKHTILPHQEIIDQIQEETTKFYGGELDVYFEDLAYKIDKIMGQIAVQSENIDSLYDVYNAMVSMKTNSIITILTIFTAIIWMMTLITGFYGMNIWLPFANDPDITRVLMWWMAVSAWVMFLFFRYKKRI